MGLPSRGAVAVALSVVLAGIAWRIHLSNRRLAAENRELRATRNRPLLIRGATLDLLSETTPILENPSAAKARQVLVLVFSASCRISQDNVNNWKRLVDQVAWRPDQEVWFITFDTWGLVAPLVQTLKERNIAFRVHRTRDPAVFPYATGIVGVPLTLVLDPDGPVQAVASGRLGDDSIHAITSCLNNERASRTERPFFAIEPFQDIRALLAGNKQ
ncbi:MAG: hypothetical protein K6T61_17980 [Bryobacteraceae bacterium]|jgi:hypothetical protein|nr:hypothetical protein [Bryobacteraceae bacterium]